MWAEERPTLNMQLVKAIEDDGGWFLNHFDVNNDMTKSFRWKVE